MFKKIQFFVAGGFFLCLILFGYFINLLQPISREVAEKTFIISSGMGIKEIAGRLYSFGLIRSKNAFKIYAFISGKAARLKPGKYNLSRNMSVPTIIKILSAGPKEISATIIPGATLKEIDDKLSNLGIIEKNSLINFNNIGDLKTRYQFLKQATSLEGFLLPDTYNFFPDSEIKSVITKLLDNFRDKTAPLIPPLTDNNDLLKLLIIASLLEKEIPSDDEQRLAAGILEKRLENGIPLQIDASIIYAKCSGRFLNCPTLIKSDYKINSVYNTYLYAGLTPTPISNPSIKALKSVIEAAPSDYWYYLSDPKTKKTIFSKTLDEHNQNRVKYLLNK